MAAGRKRSVRISVNGLRIDTARMFVVKSRSRDHVAAARLVLWLLAEAIA